MMWMVLACCVSAGPGEGVETGEVVFRGVDEGKVPELFRLKAEAFGFRRERKLETEGYEVSGLTFASPIVTGDVENNTVHAEYFRPKRAGKRPAVVVLHILGADFALSRYLAARLADRGVAALFVKLPYYGERRPAGSDKKFLSADIGRSVGAMRQGVYDVRRAAAWLGSRPEVDAGKLGVTGISLGGIVSALAAEVDPTINKGAFLLAGGDLAKVLWTMPEGAKNKQAWVDSGRTFEDLERLTRPFDPLTYAERLKGKTILMMAGNVDEVIPPASARALWEGAGRPTIRWFDCGHYSAAGFLLPAIREAVDFFAEER